jgi:LmbE family N-acetylglucosaminyl deacetylase
MTTHSTVVFLHAHPDDEAIFTGVAIRRLADAGVRVVLVTATSGEAGEPRTRLAPGEQLHHRRLDELEQACGILGVSRLVLLGYQDSGAHDGPYRPGTLGATDPGSAADALAAVVEAEGADTLVHYDPRGIYGHVDHVQVHRMGAEVVRRLGITGYQATVDHDALRRGPYHVVQEAAGDDRPLGVPGTEVSATLLADPAELLAKRAAMAAHGSQIGSRWLDPISFDETYGREWFVRTGGAAGVLDRVASTPRALTPAALVSV